MTNKPNFLRSFGRSWRSLLVVHILAMGVCCGLVMVGGEREAVALSTGQRVSFWWYEGGRRVRWTGQVLAVQRTQVRVRYLSGGQHLSRWVPRSQVVGLSGVGNLVYTCRRNSKVYFTRTGRKVCCPPSATAYNTRSGGDVICCPAGTVGVLSGQHHVLCQPSNRPSPTHTYTHTYVRPRNTYVRPRSACPAGHTLYRAKNGKAFCCPPGTSGYYLGASGITCRPSGSSSGTAYHRPSPTYGGGTASGGQTSCPRGYQAYLHRTTQRRFCCPPGSRGNTFTGQCVGSNLKSCPPVNDAGHTASSCVRFRGTTWKCWYQERPGGSKDKPCMRCACKW